MPNLEIPSQLFCQICQQPMPAEKAKRRSNTCGSKDCVNSLRRFRAALLQTGKCPYCYHPSTPEEWDLFRKFRVWYAKQNDTTLQAWLHETSGSTLRALTRKLAKALGDAAAILETRKAEILESGTLARSGGKPDPTMLPVSTQREIAELDALLGDFHPMLEAARQVLPEKAVDAKAAE
jgi:hypothetical protein